MNEKASYTYTEKETVEISRTPNEEGGLSENNTHRAYWRQVGQKETASNLWEVLV